MIQALANLARRILAHPGDPAGRPALPTQASSPSPARAGSASCPSEFARLLGDAPFRRPAERPDRRSAPAPQEGASALSPVTDGPLSMPLGVPVMPGVGAPPGAPAADGPASIALQQLWPALVRRVAWEGDARRGSMRLELGAGALAGVAVLLQCDEGRVQVRLSAPRGAGADLDAWRARIAARLTRAGLAVESVD